MKKTFENITYAQRLKESLIDALDEISTILIDHSGPFATNAVIGSRFKQVNDVDTMTKDGIQILRHVMVDNAPGTRFAVRLARFVGIAVDNRSHDGTTTSMLTFCGLAKVALEKMDVEPNDPTRYRWVMELKETLDECLVFLKTLRITNEDILARCTELGIETTAADVRAAVAYHMAMISSKGDHDLAQKISSIIRASPKKIYGMYRNIPLAVETEEPYVLKRQEFDLGVRANLGNANDYNYRNNSQYLAEDAVIFATANELTVHSMESMFLSAFISEDPRVRANLAIFGCEKGWEDYHEGRRHLIIMSPLVADPKLLEEINTFNLSNPKNKVSWMMYQVDHKLRTSFNKTLHYMAGASLFDDVMLTDSMKSLIGLDNGVHVKLIGSSLAISNLYQRDDQIFHPYYENPEAFPPYTEFCRETEEIIQLAQENITNPILDQDELAHLTSFYRALTSQTIYEIEVGGLKHDQYANQTVYEDAMGAALSAVEDGVILGGYVHLAQYLRSNFVQSSVAHHFADVFEGVVRDSLRMRDGAATQDILRKPLADKWSYVVADQASYRDSDDVYDYVKHRMLDKDGLTKFLNMELGHPVLLQAYGGYHEQFKRFKDIVPKIANSTHLIDMRREQDGDVA